MCPEDPTPHGAEILHEPLQGRFPPLRPDHHEKAPDTRSRPPLPEHVEAMAADMEDEDEDPVVETGPGVTNTPSGH